MPVLVAVEELTTLPESPLLATGDTFEPLKPPVAADATPVPTRRHIALITPTRTGFIPAPRSSPAAAATTGPKGTLLSRWRTV